jgi:hypothetical protein
MGIALVTALTLPARADVTVKAQDGSMEMTLPNGWKEAKPRGPNIKMQATDGRGASILVGASPKEDFKDFEAFTNFAVDSLKKIFPEAEPKIENTQVDGKTAKRAIISGTLPNGQNANAILTVVDAGSQYLRIMVRASASNFSHQEPVLTELANKVKITAAAAAAPAQPQASSPVRQPPGRTSH